MEKTYKTKSYTRNAIKRYWEKRKADDSEEGKKFMENVKDKRRQYYLDNKERIQARSKEYYQLNKEKIRIRNLNKKNENPI